MAITIQTSGIDAQAKYLAQNIPNLTEGQAKFLLKQAFQRGSSVVVGGSRVRGDYSSTSDLDVGFGNLTHSQAKRVINRVSKAGPLQLERMPIVPGFQSTSIPQIQTPEEFFQRSGIRGPTDPKAGQAFAPSGSITAKPDGAIVVLPPGAVP